MKVALAHCDHAFRERRHYGADDLRPGFLVRLVHDTPAHFRNAGLRRRHLESIAGKIDGVGRVALPDRENDIDRLREYLGAVFAEYSERFRIRSQCTGADAEYETASRKMIKHRGMGGDQHGVRLRQIGGAGGELDRPCIVDKRRKKYEAVGDGFALVGQVLSDERVMEAEAIRKYDCLPVLLQRLHAIPMRRVKRHHENAQSHRVCES